MTHFRQPIHSRGTRLLTGIVSAFLLALCVLSLGRTYATNPAIISFQGKVVNSDGTNVANGSYNFDFVMYSHATLGTPSDGVYDKWHELTKSVAVTNGIFQTNLGSATALPDFNANPSLYLAIRFNADAAGYMTPRVQMASVPYAANADTVGGVGASNIVQLGATQSGNINIGAGTLTSGLINGQTISTSAIFTGTLAVQGASVTVGSASQSGSLMLFDNDSGSETVTLIGGAITSSYSLTLPTAAGGTSQCLQTHSSTASQLVFSSCGTGDSITVNGSTATDANFLNTAASASVAGTTFAVNTATTPDDITLTISDASATLAGITTANAQTFGGLKTFNGGVVIAANQSLTMTGGATGSRPGSPTDGMIFYDTTTKQLITYDSALTKWKADHSAVTKIVAANNSSQALKDAADYVGDGTADDVEINLALTAAAGGKVYLAEGLYSILDTILIPNNTTLAGAGRGTLLELATQVGVSENMIENSDTGGTTGTGVTIQDMRIDGMDTNNTSGTQHGIVFTALGDGSGTSARQGGRITNVIVEDFRNSGIAFSNTDNTIVSGNLVQGNSNAGISITVSGSNNTFTNNTVQGNTNYGIILNSADSNTVTGNTAQGQTSGNGIYLTNATNNTVTGNTTQGNDGGIMLFSGSTGNVVTGNASQGNVSNGIYVGGSYNNVAGNTVTGSANGIYVGGSYNNVAGNKSHDNGGATGNNGIILATADFNTITGNDITDTSCSTTCYAINISNSTSDNNYIGNNRYIGASAADPATINDAGTGTTYASQLTPAQILQSTSTMIKGKASSNLTGTGAIVATTALSGTSTEFNSELQVGDRVTVNGETRTVTVISNDTTVTVDNAFGTTASGQTITRLPAELVVRDSSNNVDVVVKDDGSFNVWSGTSVLGTNGQAGSLIFNDGTSNMVTLTASGVGTNYSLTLPTAAGSTSQCLQTDSVTASQLVFGACAGGGGGDNISVNGSAATDANFLDTTASGTVTGVTFTLNTGPSPDTVSVSIGNASISAAGSVTTGAQTFAGVKTFDDNVFINGTLDVGSSTDRADLTVYGSILKKGITQETGLANIVDVFVYDTTRDSDGGDWTTASSSRVLSWYTEALDDGPGDDCVIASDDRCGRANFPRKAVIVTTPSAVYIFNSTDGSMFMKFTQSGTFALGVDTNNNPSGVFAINGVIYVGTNGTAGSGMYAFDFIKDRMFNYDATDRSQGDKNIANRNTTVSYATDNRTSFAFASSIVNDVHGQIIRGSQSTATATAIPLNGNLFIVAATDSSASLINMGNGKILEFADTATDDVNQVWLTARGTLYLTNETLAQLERYNTVDIDTADQITPDDIFDEQAANLPNLSKTTPTISTSPDALQVIEGSSLAQESSIATIASADTIYVGHSQGLTEIDNVTTPSATVIGWSKFYTTTTQTGFMSGTPRAMFGFDNVSGDITDSTIRNNVLQVKGTPTYSLNGVHGTSVGFNGTNQYFCSDANNDATCDTDTDFDPGLISFTVEAWFKHATTVSGTDTLIDRTYTTTPALGAGFRITMNSSGQILAGIDDDATAFDDDIITTPAGTSYADGLWHHVLFERVSTALTNPTQAIGTYLYIDGRSVGADTAIAATVTLTSASILGIGADCSVGAACGTGANFWDGQIDDVYISMGGATSSDSPNATSGAVRRRYLEGKSALSKSSTTIDNAMTATATTIGDAAAVYSPNEFAGQIVEIYGGTGVGQTRRVASNDATTLTVTPAFSVVPDTTSDYRVAPELLYGTTNSVTGIGITDNDFLGQSRTLYVGTSDGADGGGVSVFKGYGTTSRTEIYQSGAGITDDTGNTWSGTDSDDIKSVEARSDTIVIGTDANLWMQRDDRTFEQSIDQILNSLALTREELRVDGLQGISSEVGAFAGADLAENYTSDDSLEAGDIVSMAKNDVGQVNKSTVANDKLTIGIVATAPGIVLGAGQDTGYPVALVGRVPVKVSTANGEIKSGDRLTSSQIAGYGMKATSAGRVIGTALEDFSEDKQMLCADDVDQSIKCGVITVFVNLTDYTGESIDVVLSDAEKQGLTYDGDLFEPLTDLLSSNSEQTGELNKASKILSYLSARRQQLGGGNGSEVLADTISTATLNSADIYAQNIYATGFTVSDLKANRVSGLEMLTVNGSAEFKGNALFKGLVTFVEKTIFNNDITFNGRTTFNSDTAGFAVIRTGKDEVAVKFDRPYEQLPVVTLSIKNGAFADYNYKDLTLDGFTIKLKEPATQDIEFSWTALSVKDAKTSENENN